MRQPALELCLAVHGGGALDLALSRRVLDEVAAGRRPETLRIYPACDLVAFSSTDRHNPGFEGAIESARALGFGAALRLAGGSAAVFQRESLAFAWCVPAREPRLGIHQRFAAVSGWIAAALARLGVDARVGEVAGEYCPGEYSVNARGALKLMGVGQRIVRGAAHVGGVIVTGRSDRTRGVLTPVYRELGLAFDPRTAGAVDDEAPGCGLEAVRDALIAELGERRNFSERADGIASATLADAREIEHHYALDDRAGRPAAQLAP